MSEPELVFVLGLLATVGGGLVIAVFVAGWIVVGEILWRVLGILAIYEDGPNEP